MTEVGKNLWKEKNNKIFDRFTMGLVKFIQAVFLYDEEKITKSLCKPACKNIQRHGTSSMVEYSKR